MSREREPENPEDDITIPRAAMNKMIKELCPNTRVANDARELILNCSTEFIHLLSSESNEMCNNQLKKTISAEHVLMALDSLGFSDFKKDCEEVLTECKDVAAKRRRQSTRLENLGIPEEELLRQQQELFARARAAAAEQDMQMQMKNQNNPDNPTNHLAMPGNQAPSTSSIQPPLQPQTPSRLNSTQSNNDDDDEDYS